MLASLTKAMGRFSPDIQLGSFSRCSLAQQLKVESQTLVDHSAQLSHYQIDSHSFPAFGLLENQAEQASGNGKFMHLLDRHLSADSLFEEP